MKDLQFSLPLFWYIELLYRCIMRNAGGGPRPLLLGQVDGLFVVEDGAKMLLFFLPEICVELSLVFLLCTLHEGWLCMSATRASLTSIVWSPALPLLSDFISSACLPRDPSRSPCCCWTLVNDALCFAALCTIQSMPVVCVLYSRK